TTRTALSLILSGALDRNPALSIILSHAGGFLPYIHGRIFHLDETEGRDGAKAAESLKRFYYDTALPMLSITTESGPCFFFQKGPPQCDRGTAVSTRSGVAGRGCTA